ncbi:MAG: hypothetical protein IBJ03_10775 [Gemmatimonadaceae bacterium]|nr:hypothetical protein [Gemmatimonadaceae bacterium]
MMSILAGFAPAIRRRLLAGAVALWSTGSVVTLHAQGASSELLTNDLVTQMVVGKLSKDIIVGKINSSRPGFDLSSTGLISLLDNKVDQNIIKEMIKVATAARENGAATASLEGMNESLNNDAVIQMVNKKVPKSLILAKMEMAPPAFDVSAAGLVNLKTAKIPDDIIKAMISPPVKKVVAKAAPAAAPKVAPKPVGSVAIYPFAAGGLLKAQRYDTESGPVQVALGTRLLQSFVDSELWQVSDRTNDEKLLAEMDRTKGIANFKSPVILKDNVSVNARYIVVGSVERASVTSTRNSDGCMAHRASLGFTVQMGDVQSKLAVSSKTFAASYPSTNPETGREIGLRKAKLQVERLGQKCKETEADVLDWALLDAKHLVREWANATAERLKAKTP